MLWKLIHYGTVIGISVFISNIFCHFLNIIVLLNADSYSVQSILYYISWKSDPLILFFFLFFFYTYSIFIYCPQVLHSDNWSWWSFKLQVTLLLKHWRGTAFMFTMHLKYEYCTKVNYFSWLLPNHLSMI